MANAARKLPVQDNDPSARANLRQVNEPRATGEGGQLNFGFREFQAIRQECLDKTLSPTARLVLYELATHASRDLRFWAWPKVEKLVVGTGLKLRTVKYALAELYQKRAIRRKPRDNQGRNKYCLEAQILCLAPGTDRGPQLCDSLPYYSGGKHREHDGTGAPAAPEQELPTGAREGESGAPAAPIVWNPPEASHGENAWKLARETPVRAPWVPDPTGAPAAPTEQTRQTAGTGPKGPGAVCSEQRNPEAPKEVSAERLPALAVAPAIPLVTKTVPEPPEVPPVGCNLPPPPAGTVFARVWEIARKGDARVAQACITSLLPSPQEQARIDRIRAKKAADLLREESKSDATRDDEDQ